MKRKPIDLDKLVKEIKKQQEESEEIIRQMEEIKKKIRKNFLALRRCGI